MNNALVKPEILTLVQALQHILGQKDRVISDSISSAFQLISSPSGIQAAKALNKVMSTWGKDGKTIALNTPNGQISFSLGSAFALFLILILLILLVDFSAI
ncbi:MAG: hypothetical protein CVV03_06085 [Firmicutes bacterium HGW-Firmicutes-8]|nr:MAG: hypothetical protein CVV03_06085 [Firmicutes bacterium HGW-Firmicutes-8]